MCLILKSVDVLLVVIFFFIIILVFIILQKDLDEMEKENEIDVEVVELGKEMFQLIVMFLMKEK